MTFQRTLIAAAICALLTPIASATDITSPLTDDWSGSNFENSSELNADGHSIFVTDQGIFNNTNGSILNANKVELSLNNSTATTYLKAGIINAKSIVYKGGNYNLLGRTLEDNVQLTTPLLTIEGSSSESGLLFTKASQAIGIDKVLVKTGSGRTALVIGGTDVHFRTVELAGTGGDPRVKVNNGASANIDSLIVSGNKAKVQVVESGSISIKNILVKEDQKIGIEPWSDNNADTNKAVYEIGEVTLKKNATFATNLYSKDKQQTIQYAGTPVFNLAEGATVDLSSALKSDGVPTKATLTASNVTIRVEDAASANVYVPEADNRKGTAISVVGDGDNNTGNAAQDLSLLSSVVKEKTDDKTGVSGVVVTQEANDIYDAATGVVSDDGTVTNVQTTANANTNGIAETTAVGLHIWRNEINDMNKRLGELRDSRADANGLWARVYNGKAKFGEQHVTNKYTAFQFGYDRQVFDGVWLGGAFSYTKGDSDFKQGDGDSHLFAFTGYGSWVAENGAFLDVTAKVGRLKNGFDIRLDSGDLSSASYHTNAVSFSAEAGWRVAPFGNAFFIEPQAEIMAGHVYDATYETSTGLTVKQDAADALIGRAGLVVGLASAELGNCYVRASVLHDWEGDATFNYSKGSANRTITESLGGTWYEYGLGVNANVAKNVHVYADLEAADGGKVDTSYRFNLGVRYSF